MILNYNFHNFLEMTFVSGQFKLFTKHFDNAMILYDNYLSAQPKSSARDTQGLGSRCPSVSLQGGQDFGSRHLQKCGVRHVE